MQVKRRSDAAAPSRKRKPLGDDAFDWGDDGVVHSSSSGSEEEEPQQTDSSDDEDDAETAAAKRVRIAKEYLDNLQDNDEDEEENIATPYGISGDKIAQKLENDVKEAQGKLFRPIALQLLDFEFDQESCRFYRGHKLSTTSTALSCDGKMAFSVSKDGSILKWDLTTGRKSVFTFPNHDDEPRVSEQRRCLLAIALSSDGKFLATGGRDKLLRIWNPATKELMETFSGHRDAISCLTFRDHSTALFSGSHDRSIKHWNLTEMGYVETLFGHQSYINAVDSLNAERVFSCSNDKSVRMWKIPEETQLIFNGHGSMDCLCMINEQYCVTGTDEGSLILWFNGRKKPVFTQPEAHGSSNWISSVAILRGTDLLATGSCDGVIRLWHVDLKKRCLSQVGTIPALGFVNSLAFARNGRFLLAGVGQEHRLGRWTRIKNAKNGILLIALPQLS